MKPHRSTEFIARPAVFGFADLRHFTTELQTVDSTLKCKMPSSENEDSSRLLLIHTGLAPGVSVWAMNRETVQTISSQTRGLATWLKPGVTEIVELIAIRASKLHFKSESLHSESSFLGLSSSGGSMSAIIFFFFKQKTAYEI